MGIEKIREIPGKLKVAANPITRTIAAGLLALSLSPQMLPKSAEAQVGCAPVVLGPFPANSDPETRRVSAGNSIVDLEVYAPSYGLGDEPIRTVIDRNGIVVEFAPNAAGIGWKYGENCPLDQAILHIDSSGRKYMELGDVLARRALVQIESDQVIVSTPVRDPEELSTAEEAECKATVLGPFGPESRAIIDTEDRITRIQVFAPHKGMGGTPVDSILDRGGLRVRYAEGVAGISWKNNVECSLEQVLESMGNVRLVELAELVAKGVVELLPSSDQPR